MCEHCTRREFLGTGVASSLMLAGATWTHAWASQSSPPASRGKSRICVVFTGTPAPGDRDWGADAGQIEAMKTRLAKAEKDLGNVELVMGESRSAQQTGALLEKAGIDERSAFQTHEQLEQTLRGLTESGVAFPWGVPTRHSRDTLHNIASWIWSAGGEFASADGKHILFNEAKARAGIRAYFDLHRYLAPSARHKDESDSLFKQGQAAVVMSGPWMWPMDASRPDVVPEVAANIGVAIPLGIAFVGFSYLVVWEHSRHRDLAMRLVRELTSPQVLAAYAPRTGPLSVHLDALDSSPMADDANYQVMVQALKTGRTFPQISLWGLIEDKLDVALEDVWKEVLAESQPDIDAIMSEHIDPLARRLEMTLSQE